MHYFTCIISVEKIEKKLEKRFVCFRYSQVYTDLHRTISNTDADMDLKWWAANHGNDMPMAWPVFEVSKH